MKDVAEHSLTGCLQSADVNVSVHTADVVFSSSSASHVSFSHSRNFKLAAAGQKYCYKTALESNQKWNDFKIIQGPSNNPVI